VRRSRPEGNLADWADTHPDIAEAEAVHRAAFLASQAGCRLYIVHLSSRAGLEAAREERADRRKLHVETTSPYLSLTKHDPNGLLAKMSPPVRAQEDVDALWDGLRAGIIDCVGTDNTSRDRATKNPAGGLWGARPGYPVLGTHLAALLHEGYHRRGVPLEILAARACAAPARVFGLYPQKGTLAVGSDADLAVIDLDLEREVRPASLHSFSDFSPFEGRTLKGWATAVIKGGRLAYRDGEVLAAPGTGRYLARHAD
jgi:dihydroorotase-like cyclic amidohydrolase